MSRHFLSQLDLTVSEIEDVFRRAADLKIHPLSKLLDSRTLVMFFEKASTRTRLSFEIGMTQLGGHAVYLDRESSQLSRGESIADTARVVSRYADGIMARVNAHETLEELAANASVPVINGLSDREHPCQSMADLFTIRQHKGRLSQLKIAYLGDGNNNVTHSLMLACSIMGAMFYVASPAGLEPDPSFIDLARTHAAAPGGPFLVADPMDAVRDADVVYTDVWVSMGREANSQERMTLLEPYRVTTDLVSAAAPDSIFMHCLPAHIGDEVTSEVAYGAHSVIFDQAENRLHVQKALLLFLLSTVQGDA